MTKEEIRAISISKLDLQPHSVLYDVGAGTGSVTVEAALAIPHGSIYAVERDRAALDLIHKNLEKFGVKNVQVISGEAPGCLWELPPPDRVFVGGSGGKLPEIIQVVDKRLKVNGCVVINAVTLETAYKAVCLLEAGNYRTEAVTVSISRLKRVGSSHLWQALNPVTIIWGVKED